MTPHDLPGLLGPVATGADKAALGNGSRSGDWDRLAFAGQSPAVSRLRLQLERIAPHYRNALLVGEPGSGKEMAARRLHALSPVAKGPFVAREAAVLAEDDAALASVRRGTLYINGLGMLPLTLQDGLARRLLHLERLVRARMAETRVVAASHCDLRTLASTGRFRQDLYGRIAVVEVRVPALRERLDDLEALAEFCLRMGIGSARRLAADAVACLAEYRWPGNLEELRRVLAHAAGLAEGDTIEIRHLPELEGAPCTQHQNAEPPVVERLDDVVRRHVIEVLSRCAGNKLRAAELLGISRSTLYRMLDAG